MYTIIGWTLLAIAGWMLVATVRSFYISSGHWLDDMEDE